jgi:hypothetical protein
MTAQDSLGRTWQIGRDSYGLAELIPIGHDTDPDSPALSVEDERALLELLPTEIEDMGIDCSYDPGEAYDRVRQGLKEMMVGM